VRASTFSGEQIAQVNNPDPFAVPVWRSPVYHTPGWLIGIVQVARLLGVLIAFVIRHPLADLITFILVLVYAELGWPADVTLIAAAAVALAVWWWCWRASFTRFVTRPVQSKWRRWHYRRRWAAVMTIGRLAPVYQGRVLLPVLGKVTSTGSTDRLAVRLVSGQSAADFAARADNLAHGFGAVLCRVRTGHPGMVVLELVRRDALAAMIPALPIPSVTDLGALVVGRHEDGTLWTVRLQGTHLLLAGSTGAGKASLLWGLVRALLPAMQAGLVRPLAADPKLMELAYGRAIFDRYGRYAADPAAILAMLEDAVMDMQDRAAQLAGRHREHTPSAAHPFVVVFVDEVAFLTAYHPDRQLRDRIKAALSTLTTQGRAVGYCVVAALQDPRKEVMSIRNLFPDRIAMRLDEPEQVDMVLGDGARDRGALADRISTDPPTGAGVAYIRLATDPDPVRVRAAFVTDTDIAAMAASTVSDHKLVMVLA
jgi:S-DNA-T family DNA segregation ATPase FtsK/SpoIIIE